MGQRMTGSDILYATARTEVYRDGSGVVRKVARGPGALRRARHETAMLARLDGVAGVPCLAPGDGTAGTVAMRDCHGVPLAERLREGPLTLGVLIELAAGLAALLVEVHRRGVVHKDVNPANILQADRPYLIDFELATFFAEERPGFGHHSMIQGTAAYLAPEQTGRTSWAVDTRADLYSLGATLYEAATGQPPFGTGDLGRLVHDHLARVPVSPAQLRPGLPDTLARIILRLLEKEPDRRYQSAEGLLHDLRRLGEPGGAGFPLGERDFPVRLRPPSRLVGRDAEAAQLVGAFDGAVAGRCRGVLVTGPPGVGKSALIDELRAPATTAGGWFVTGKFDQYRQDAEADGVRQALGGLVRLLLAEPADELAEHGRRLRATLAGNAEVVAGLLPGVAPILQCEPLDSDGMAALDQGRLVEAGLAVLHAIATPSRPVVMVLDDLQWAGPTPIGFVDALLAGAGPNGLLLVGAYRDREVDAVHPLTPKLARWARLDVAPGVLALQNLPASDLATMLGEMLRLDGPRAAELAREIGARSGGNPFDTVELINALRDDGTLELGPDGWRWDAGMVRRHVGRGDVLDLLAARIGRLPEASQLALERMACLGGEVSVPLLAAAAGEDADHVEAALAPALEDGLLVVDGAEQDAVRFRHDRVQQAAHQRSDPAARLGLRLDLARRLAGRPDLVGLATEQYRAVTGLLDDPGERRRVAQMLHAAARGSQLLNPAMALDFLTAAGELPGELDPELLLELDIDRHAVLCGLGRHAEADELFAVIRGRGPQAVRLAGPAGVQISSLSNRNLQTEAVTLGLDLLGRLGMPPPGEIEPALDALEEWAGDPGGVAADLARPPVTDPVVLATGELIYRTLPATYFSGHPAFFWLTCQAQRLWAEHGPAAALIGPVAYAFFPMNQVRGDYRVGYRAARRVIEVGQARGYLKEAAQAQLMYVMTSALWFEPVEEVADLAVRTRETLQLYGDWQSVLWTYVPSLPIALDCQPELDAVATEVQAVLAIMDRAGIEYSRPLNIAYRQLIRSLRGETARPGGFGDAEVDEDELFAQLAENPPQAGQAHAMRALSAAVFDDAEALGRHAAQAVKLLPYNSVSATFTLVHLFDALGTGPLDEHLSWLTARAQDAPGNFQAMVYLVEAERDWRAGNGFAAVRAFELAMREVRTRRRPWQRALITERAGRCYLASGLEQAGRALLAEARDHYADWGADGKAARLADEYPFLRHAGALHQPSGSGTTSNVAGDVIDLRGVLAAARALTSETDLDRLRERVAEILQGITGATGVHVALWDRLEDGAPVPLTAVRYAERTREPLVLDDAPRDDRFAADPYLTGLPSCSLLVVPILSQGQPRAMLVLENRLTSGAFTTDRLDAINLIAGQLAVCVDNALLYASLEEKVADRTRELAAARDQLELLSLTDQLTGLPNRRRLTDGLHAAWEHAARTLRPVAVAMIDVDQFKLYNDHYGHPAGDACLAMVAKTMAGCVRTYDLVARYGGEEFCVVLPETGVEDAYTVAERIRADVAARAEPHVTATHGVVTVSIGVAAVVPEHGSHPEGLIEAADTALYQSKHAGRNRATMA
jgi:diguanylate cyclase (GGDEF)-like protein